MDYHAHQLFQSLLGVYIEHWGRSDEQTELIREQIAALLLTLKQCVTTAHWQVRGKLRRCGDRKLITSLGIVGCFAILQ